MNFRRATFLVLWKTFVEKDLQTSRTRNYVTTEFLKQINVLHTIVTVNLS